jgi:pyrimidine-nucleoside phosphorylase
VRVCDIIEKKKKGRRLSREEIAFIVNGFTRGEVPDYQMSAFLMCVYFQGMDEEETTDLTMVMMRSGEVVDLSAIPGIKVDKHSTGGVGDTTTLILAPLVAAAGIPVAKMSGRGLGHTGGTLDKLESIPGFRVQLSGDEFIEQVKKIGLAIIGQTADLAPADGRIYKLRDVTSTVDSIPLIAGSIMSKKLAAGTDAILLDVKTGSGAFMPTMELSRELARVMVKIGCKAGKRVRAVITDMDQPLGTMIGNALEVREAVEILNGEHRGSALREVSVILGGHLIQMGGAADTLEEGRAMAEKMIANGLGARKFKEMIAAQGGSVRVVEDLSLLPQPGIIRDVPAPGSGCVNKINALAVGRAAMVLGAGRERKEDVIDPAVGLIIRKRVGDKVETGEFLVSIYANDEVKFEKAEKIILDAFDIGEDAPSIQPLVLDTIMEDA